MPSIVDPAYGIERLRLVKNTRTAHSVEYDVSESQWERIQGIHKSIILEVVPEESSVLHVACACGLLANAVPDRAYEGVDVCRELIRFARGLNPRTNFHVVEDYRSLPFPERTFDFAVVRSFDGTIKRQLGFGYWRQVETEILRVADRLIILGLEDPHSYRIVDAVQSPEEFTRNVIECEGGRLTYRAGQDGTCELYDLLVDEACRRQGVGTKLVNELLSATFGCVYGFTRTENTVAQAFYSSLGFGLIVVPGLYRGSDGVIFFRSCFNKASH